MSSELKANHKKRTSSQSIGEPLTDHRKRPRNRTMQSCLNCHTSKRMCDKKKPCGRCVKLGLTGLCVYEVDNLSNSPTYRTDTQDHDSPLRQRVAELEGVIRQMKNKPHPRWARSGANPELDKRRSRCESDTADDTEISEYCSVKASLSAPAGKPLFEEAGKITAALAPPLSTVPVLSVSTHSGIHRSLVAQTTPSPTSPSTYYSPPSPFRSLPTALSTPVDKPSSSYAGIVEDQQPCTTDFDFASIFMTYPDLISSCGKGGHHTSQHHAPHHAKADPAGHYVAFQSEGEQCGCLNESLSYQAVLELSLRLRKAADLLSRSAYHHMGTQCTLNKRISDLDVFAASALGNVLYTVETSLTASSPSSRPTSSYSATSPPFAYPHHRSWFLPTTLFKQSHSDNAQQL